MSTFHEICTRYIFIALLMAAANVALGQPAKKPGQAADRLRIRFGQDGAGIKTRPNHLLLSPSDLETTLGPVVSLEPMSIQAAQVRLTERELPTRGA